MQTSVFFATRLKILLKNINLYIKNTKKPSNLLDIEEVNI